MSHPYRDPHYQPTSGHYPASENVPRQSEQHGLPFSTTQDPYSIHTSQHGIFFIRKQWKIDGLILFATVFPGPTPPEGRQHPQPSGHSGGYPPYAEGPLTFPDPYPESSPPQRASAGHSTIYGAPPPSQTMNQSTLGSYQQERQPPYDYLSSGGSSDSHRAYTTASSITSGSVYARSEFQPHPGPSSDYTNMDSRAEPQHLNASLYDGGPHGSDTLQKAPSNPPTAGRSKQ